MSGRRHRFAAALALVAGALAALAGEPRPPLAADEVSAVQLAEWIRDRRDLLLLDLRATDAVPHERLPGARAAADVDDASLQASDLLVVYDAQDVEPSAVDALRRRALPRPLLRLQGGVAAWHADVLFPSRRADASSRQRRLFDMRAALSRYFGGSPRVLEPGATRERRRSRRGC